MKPIVKEIVIMILVFIIIVLGFGILLYDYIPTKQAEIVISEYEPTNEVKETLRDIATSETTDIILTYEVTDTDLGVYEATKSYNKGKANPFSSYQETASTQNSSGNVTTNNNNSSNGTNNSSQNSNNNESNTFYEKNDTK